MPSANSTFSLLALRCSLALATAGFTAISHTEDQPVISEASNTEALATTKDSTVTYTADFFAQYAPVNARNMLDRIPGISLALAPSTNDRRGLGAGENQILINGKRVAGKGNDGRDTLGQIAASQVSHIEIIRGTSGDLDVRSAGPIINVVLKQGVNRSSLSAEVNVDYYKIDGHMQPGGAISYGGETGDLNYLVSASIEPRYQREIRHERSVIDLTPDDGQTLLVPNDSRDEDQLREETEYKISSNFSYALTANDLLQLNLLYREADPPRVIDREYYERLYETAVYAPQREVIDAELNSWEIGGTYQHKLATGSTAKTIFIVNDKTYDYTDDRYSRISGNRYLYIDNQERYRERIVRSSISNKLTDTQDLEYGLEAAQTLNDVVFILGSSRATGDIGSNTNGLPLSIETYSTVEEMRWEPFVIHNWQLSDQASLESTLVIERSTISQSGRERRANVLPATGNSEFFDLTPSRDFIFYKPKFDFRYDLNGAAQLRATLERSVKQMSFRDFVASSDGDTSKDVAVGNTGLKQEQAWELTFNGEYRLASDGGVLNGKLYYHRIEDALGRVDVTPENPTELEYASAPGNVGDGHRVGLDLDASIRLGFIDLPDALLSFGVKVKDSEVYNDFVGEKTRFPQDSRGDWNVSFRQDIARWNFNYGFNYRYYFQGNNTIYDVDDIEHYSRDAAAGFFLEKVAFDGITFRFESMNTLDYHRCLERIRFYGYTIDGQIKEVENSCIGPGPKYALKVRTTF